MKNTYLKVLLFLFIFQVHSIYSQDLLWEKSFGGRHGDYLFDVLATADNGFILAGSSLSNKSGNKQQEGTGDLDYLIWKMDEEGSSEWQKSFGGSGSDLLKVVLNTSDGGFILGGVSNSPLGFDKTEAHRGGTDYWILKLNAKGDVIWQKVYGGKGLDELSCLIATNDGGYILGGSSSSSVDGKGKSNLVGGKKENSRGSLDYWIIKIDSQGNEIWQHTYGGKYSDQLQSIVATKDGGYLVGGYSNSPASKDKIHENLGKGNDFWLLKLNTVGKIEWQQVLGGTEEDQLKVVIQTHDGNYVVAGHSKSVTRSTKNGSDLWMVKLDLEGSILWEVAHNIGKNDILTSLLEQEDHTFIVGAYSPTSLSEEQDKEGLNDYVVLQLSSIGEELWRKSYGSNGADVLQKLISTRDGGYLLIGTSDPEFKGRKSQLSKGVHGINPFNSNESLAGAQRLQEGIDSEVQHYSQQFNDAVKAETTTLVDGVNQTLEKHNNSGFKVGVNSPVGDLLNPSNGNSSKGSAQQFENFGPKKGIKISRDKKVSYGGRDFWVVKLKDKEQQVKERLSIEAYPNPTYSYVNIAIGFEYDRGTLSVYDIGGRELESFKIEQRTVPVNLSAHPMGIYIVKVKTNKGSESIKIIKN